MEGNTVWKKDRAAHLMLLLDLAGHVHSSFLMSSPQLCPALQYVPHCVMFLKPMLPHYRFSCLLPSSQLCSIIAVPFLLSSCFENWSPIIQCMLLLSYNGKQNWTEHTTILTFLRLKLFFFFETFVWISLRKTKERYHWQFRPALSCYSSPEALLSQNHKSY